MVLCTLSETLVPECLMNLVSSACLILIFGLLQARGHGNEQCALSNHTRVRSVDSDRALDF